MLFKDTTSIAGYIYCLGKKLYCLSTVENNFISVSTIQHKPLFCRSTAL